MRLDEFANAEDQMALWKLINDNVWQAIETNASNRLGRLKPKQPRPS